MRFRAVKRGTVPCGSQHDGDVTLREALIQSEELEGDRRRASDGSVKPSRV
jgi:hypothetical protein